MKDLVEVGLHTVSSTWVSPFSDRLVTPYRRVVGIQHRSEMPQVDWSVINPFHPDFESDYDASQTSLEVIAMPELTAERLVTFYKRYFSEPQDPQGSWYPGAQIEEYNCHRFGYWMRGTRAAQDYYCPMAPDHITEGFSVSNPLPPGRHGVLGTVGAAVHSVVGLGADRDDCLQVLATDGYMGIDTYENIVDQYDYMRTARMQFFA